jgi:hypothetical protein
MFGGLLLGSMLGGFGGWVVSEEVDGDELGEGDMGVDGW